MSSFRKKIYFHMEKGEQIHEIENQAKSLGFHTESLRWIGYEVEMEIEIFESGANKVLTITSSTGEKIDVSDKGISL